MSLAARFHRQQFHPARSGALRYGDDLDVDVLTTRANPANLDGRRGASADRYEFHQADIANRAQLDELMTRHQFSSVVGTLRGVPRGS